MNPHSTVKALSAIVILAVAGAAAPAVAQYRSDTSPQSSARNAATDFRSSKWLISRKVVNDNNEEIADVSDLLLERGTGRIEYVIIKTGASFGLGGRAIAIPHNSFRWETGGKDRFILAATPEQLKEHPEYTPAAWKELKRPLSEDRNALGRKLAADAASPSDPYSAGFEGARRSKIQGKIIAVDRVRSSAFGEQTHITVRTDSGSTERIALGPSWYVNGAPGAPMRGDVVTVEAVALPRDPEQLHAATDLRTGDRHLRLRDAQGSPAWALRSEQSGDAAYSAPFSRYLLLSQLPGTKIDCRGTECGEVHDVIIERYSGDIAFLSIDPNENFLGINDTKRLLPWSIAAVMTDGPVRIDASKEMVLASPETPSDLSMLSSGDAADRVYKAFDVPAPRFDQGDARSDGYMRDKSNAWSANGPIMSCIDRNSHASMSGKVTELTEVRFEGATNPAKAVKIRTAGEEREEIVLLGPSAYMDNQADLCRVGDVVTLDACRTTIDGRQYWLAKSLDRSSTRVEFMDRNYAPVWDQR